ncbi:MAG: hypothetical protein K2Y22_00845 [Candidatus Obscuribacterales bacterium]|nr:hypothetical protein [Candidatus Obscuribacterales bacterium]
MKFNKLLPAALVWLVFLANPAPAEVILSKFSGKVVHDFTVLNAGSLLRVEVLTPLDTSSAKLGDRLECRIIDYISVIGHQVACPKDIVTGKIVSIYRPKKTIKAYIPGRTFLNADARVGLNFDTITTKEGIHTTISAKPAPKSRVTKYYPSKIDIVVDRNGEYETKYDTKKLLAVDAAITAASFAAGPAGILVAPALSGAAGAVSSTFAQGRPLEKSEKTNKPRDIAVSVGKGLPGGSIVSGVTTRGAHLFLEKGDQLLLILNQDAYFYRGANNR